MGTLPLPSHYYFLLYYINTFVMHYIYIYVLQVSGCGFDHPPNRVQSLKEEYGHTSTHLLGFHGLFWGRLDFY